jgi:hypothetical protein
VIAAMFVAVLALTTRTTADNSLHSLRGACSEINRVTANCAEPTPAATYTLTVRVHQKGTWQAGQGQWIDGAEVLLSDPIQPSQFAERSAITNANGEAVFTDVPASRPLKPYTIKARKRGCVQVRGSSTEAPSITQYTMGAYDSRMNLALNCNR